jgi:hypothetical protein
VERTDFDRLPKVVGYYSVGYVQEAAKLGFSVYESRGSHPKLVFHGHHGWFNPNVISAIDMFVMPFFSTVLLC